MLRILSYFLYPRMRNARVVSNLCVVRQAQPLRETCSVPLRNFTFSGWSQWRKEKHGKHESVLTIREKLESLYHKACLDTASHDSLFIIVHSYGPQLQFQGKHEGSNAAALLLHRCDTA